MKLKEDINPVWGKAFKRISQAFHDNFDKIEWVTQNPDYELVHIVGGLESEYILKSPNPSKIIAVQHCHRTTGVSQEAWNELWSKVALVISYMDLPSFTSVPFNFFRTPWGANPDTFIYYPTNKDIKVFTTGHVAFTECLDKVYQACVFSNNRMFHTGENFKWNNKYYQHLEYMDNETLANVLLRTQYTTGLRLIEGFEMMCIEGAMCGVTPIVPNQPSYDFYDNFAIKIDAHGNIVEQLTDIFKADYVPLSEEKIKYVRETFDWKVICNKIQKAILDI